MKKVVALFPILLLFSVSVSAQGQSRKVDANLMALLGSIESGVNKVTGAEDSVMAPGRWNAPAVLVNAAKERYETQKVSVEALHAIISRIKSEGVVSSSRLFSLYTVFRNVEDSIDDVAAMANASNPESSVANDLMNLKTVLTPQRGKLGDTVDRSIQLDSSVLAACIRTTGKANR